MNNVFPLKLLYLLQSADGASCLLVLLLGHTPVFISPLLYMQTMLTCHLNRPASGSFNSLTIPFKMMVCFCYLVFGIPNSSSILVAMDWKFVDRILQ